MVADLILFSFKIAFISTIFTFALGLFFARIFTNNNFRGKGILEVLIILPMVMPPTITGYALLIFMGRRMFLGKLFYSIFGTTIIFTPVAACTAAIIVSLPLMYQSCKAALINIDQCYINAARTMNASERKIFWKVILPLAWPGIVSGIILSFARALGEFGATLMVAGNIPGKTQTIPTALYFAVENGNTAVANTLLGIEVVFSFLLVFGLNIWLKKKNYNLVKF